MRLAPVEVGKNIKSVVADNVKPANFFVVVFTKTCISDYSIKKVLSQTCSFRF